MYCHWPRHSYGAVTSALGIGSAKGWLGGLLRSATQGCVAQVHTVNCNVIFWITHLALLRRSSGGGEDSISDQWVEFLLREAQSGRHSAENDVVTSASP